MTAIDLLRRLVAWDRAGDIGVRSLDKLVAVCQDTRTFLAEYDEAPVVEIDVTFSHSLGDRWVGYPGGDWDGSAAAIGGGAAKVRIPVPRHLWKPEKIEGEVVE